MKKGIVLEVHDEDVTILTPEGEFLKSRKQKGHVDIGEEITFFPLHQTEKSRMKKVHSILISRWTMIVAAAIIILALSFYPRYVSNQVYAYISVDVNPSIELGVNKKMEVISMEAYNDEGRKIIEQLVEWKKQDISKVTTDLFDVIRQQGYFKENREVLIASLINNETKSSWKTEMQGKITALSETIKTENVNITTMESTLNKRTDALKEGLSPGKFIQKEKEQETVDSVDTSKREVIPTTQVKAKPSGVNIDAPKSEKTSEIVSKAGAEKALKAEQKEKKKDRKEARVNEKAKRKTERNEKKAERKMERNEKKEERKTERNEKKEERKTERNEKKEERKAERKEKKEERKAERKERRQDRKEDREHIINERKKDLKKKENEVRQNIKLEKELWHH
ncbi:Anti-sigma-I factor RsgI [Bacillus sp. THAF10]|uniref:anti-sigma factor domain-containing protein n=1 Tax=Bacillus sp. THAF10 TaxID=2587848 RepID=UPI001267EC1D|nr:anti-sigma factor domain-containing protein [Bacillus sp. THAF10]QFT88496.1 Anti-sigma-I factor RsgI [Bacillus sp. THAF10]